MRRTSFPSPLPSTTPPWVYLELPCATFSAEMLLSATIALTEPIVHAEEAELLCSDDRERGFFTMSAAISNDTVEVGASGNDDIDTHSVSAYRVRYDSTRGASLSFATPLAAKELS